MAMTVTHANAVVIVVEWLASRTLMGRRAVDDERAREALTTLAGGAAKTLQITVPRELVDAAVERHVAAESDGAAQALAQAMHRHIAHGGALPWPSIRKAFEDWVATQEGLTASDAT